MYMCVCVCKSFGYFVFDNACLYVSIFLQFFCLADCMSAGMYVLIAPLWLC